MINSLAAQQQCNTFVEIYFLRFPTIWQIRLTIAYIYYSSIYVKYIGTLLWYAKYYEMMKTLKVKSPCVVCCKLNKNTAISFLHVKQSTCSAKSVSCSTETSDTKLH